MKQYHVNVIQPYQCGVNTLFNFFSDPFNVADILAMPCDIVQYSQTKNRYGIGMKKRVRAIGSPAFEEEIINFQLNHFIAYRVTKGGIVTNHLGELRFHEKQFGSELEYHIRFSPRWPIPFLGQLIQKQLANSLQKGLAKAAQSLN